MPQQQDMQIAGSANSAPLEVDANTLAAHFILRPQDFRSLGSYHAGATYTYVNAQTSQPLPATNAVLASMRAQNTPGMIYLIRKVNVAMMMFQVAGGTVGNAVWTVQLARVQQFGSQYVAGLDGAVSNSIPVKQLSPQEMGCKLDANTPDPTLDFIMPGDATAGHTSTLLAPTIQTSVANMIPIVSGANPFASVNGMSLTATTAVIIPPTFLFDQRVSEYPLIFEPLNGAIIVVPSTTPAFATQPGTITFTLTVAWDELLLRDYDP